jgi:hypothetical protein
MVESSARVVEPPTRVARGPWLPGGIAGAVAIAAALWAAGVCLSETPTAVDSWCGTCRGEARSSLYVEAAWAIGVCMAAALAARVASRWEFRVARSAALVALVFWLASLGFVRGWW